MADARTIAAAGVVAAAAVMIMGGKVLITTLHRVAEAPNLTRSLPEATGVANSDRAAASGIGALRNADRGLIIAEKVQNLYNEAKINIISDLDLNIQHGVPLTEDQISILINKEIIRVVNIESKQHEPSISIEVLTGKVSIKKSTTLAGVSVSFGDVNIYKTTAVVAAGIYACVKLASVQFRDCVDTAMDGVKEILLKALEGDTAAPDGKKII